METMDYHQKRCPHGWVDVTQCEPCATAAEREAFRKDAMRYRWLAARHDKPGAVFICALDDNGNDMTLTAAIDAAMAGECGVGVA